MCTANVVLFFTAEFGTTSALRGKIPPAYLHRIMVLWFSKTCIVWHNFKNEIKYLYMKLKSVLLFLVFLGAWMTGSAQIRQEWCIQDAIINSSRGDTLITFCEGDGLPDQVRFRVSPFVQPFAYLVTDENNTIILVSRNNTINLDGLGGGRLRVWAFAYLGNILAEPGQNATTAELADICYGLTQNFIPINGVVPDGGTIATTDGKSSLFTCPDDGTPDIVAFSTTSTDPFYTYVITDENDRILAFAPNGVFDFENLSVTVARVRGVSYVGRVTAEVGDVLTEVDFATGCFDLSNNFVEVTRSSPQGGTVSLASGETSKTICAESVEGTNLAFVRQTSAENPYAFIITDENGVVITVLEGNNADFSLTEPGICRVYGVSYTGALTIAVGENINDTPLSDDCFDLSGNFVEIIKREVDGGRVSLAEGGTNRTVCVEGGESPEVFFTNTSNSESSSYAYLITNDNNVILAVFEGESFNFANINNRINRVWGLSYSGTLLAQPGDNAATRVLASECYDLSDNFVVILRKSVEGGVVQLNSGEATAEVCGGDGIADELIFLNSSTSIEAYIYLITDVNGIVVDFISGDRFDFENLDLPEARVYGLSYSGALTVAVGNDINTADFSGECADLSSNFVTVFRRFVDGGRVSLPDGSEQTVICSGDDNPDVLSFVTTSTSDENYAFVITTLNNDIIAIADGDSYDFAGDRNAIFRVWGLSYTGNILAQLGDNAATTALTDGCFLLSDNFIVVQRDIVDGATVSLEDGSLEAVYCLGTQQPGVLVFANTSEAFANYAYLLTTEENIVIETTLANSFDLTGFPGGNYRVWGVSYKGNLTVRTNDDAAAVALADDCFNLSDNFVRISTREVEGGAIALAGGGDSAIVCVGDFNPNTLDFVTEGAMGDYAFLITDESNIILAIATEASFDFSELDATTLRVWGLAYSGNLSAQIGDDAAATDLSDECYDLSDNFITVARDLVDGATVSLDNGETNAVTCAGAAEIAPLAFANTSTAGDYAYLVTDENNRVLAIVTESSFSFAEFPQGNYRVWGVSYTGALTVAIGDDASAAVLAERCYHLSENFISVVQKNVDGGTVRLPNGNTSAIVCGSGASAGQLMFNFESSANANYLFLITDRNDVIFAILTGNTVSFGGVRIGDYRVWGVSYTGNVTARTGRNINEIDLSDECFDISENFIAVRKDDADGGTIAVAGSDEGSFEFCPDNGVADVLNFTTTGNSSGTYVFVLTDSDNNFIAPLNGASIDFDTLPEGNYRVWGLAFTGNLLIQPGQNAATTPITDACFDLSDNFISITNAIPVGGSLALNEDGDTQQFTCPGDGMEDIVSFISTGSAGPSFVFLITDENNIIEAITTENSFDFERDTEGVNRVWGLAYSGNLLAQIGDDAAAVALSDDCFALSSNFLEIIRETPVGGDVFIEGGDTEVFLCVEGTSPAVVKFDSTGTSRGDYIYVITDANNVIRNGIFGDEFDFSFLPPGTYRVWGLAYTGMLIATIGDVVTEVPISDDCFELSATFATVFVTDTDGGSVATTNGATEVRVCTGDGQPDVLTFENTSTSFAEYVYLLTDKENQLLTIIEGNSFDFDSATLDTCLVWGLSHSGNLLVEEGDNILITLLTDGCFELSNNFVRIIKARVDGGSISSDRNTDLIFTCVGDGVPDVILFSNTGEATGASYIYVLTNENNAIRGTIVGDAFNFETSGVGVTRIWGVSYTGQFTGAFNANITTAVLASGCFQLSENFITVSRDTPFGGDVSTEDGATSTFFCPSVTEPSLRFATTSNRRVGYRFVVTNTANDIVALSQGNAVNFAALPVGTYRVWGISYAGDLLLEIGGNILSAEPLASSCFEISSGFVEVYRSRMVDGGRITNIAGPDTLFVCPQSLASDLVVATNNSQATEANYRYILTNANNVILSRNLDNPVIDFDGAMPGRYRIWGVSYTGEFRALASDNAATAMLSDSCFQLSANFISVIVDTPRGGMVATSDTLTDITVDADNAMYNLIALNASIVHYQYVVTDADDRIVNILAGNTVDFADFPASGPLRIYGVAYTGVFTGAEGDVITEANLSDDCYDVSSNFIAVTFAEPFTDNEPPVLRHPSERAHTPLMQVSVAPNPATDFIRIAIALTNPEEMRSNLRIFSLTGQLMHEEVIHTEAGANQLEMRINQLPDGLYLLQLRNGQQVQTVRFLKQWQ